VATGGARACASRQAGSESALVAGAIQPRFLTELSASERPESFAWAAIPRQRTPGMTEASIRFLIEVVDLIRSPFARRKLRERSAGVGFPLDHKMAMVVTNERVIIWRSSRRSLRSPVLVGSVPRSRIRSASFPFVGGHWKLVEVSLTTGARVRFRVDNQNAAAFVTSLTSDESRDRPIG
jgi:hypothetical protein